MRADGRVLAMIVVGGEALVDLVPTADGALWPRLGGGPYTTAVGAARLAAPTAMLTRISTDTFGDALLRRLTETGVSTALVQRGPEPTSLAVVAVDDEGGAHYSFYTDGTADRKVTDPGPLPPDVTTVALGTLGLVLEPGASVYETVLMRQARTDTLVAVDPNIRSALIGDPDAYRRRFTGWLPSVGLVKASADDARWLVPGSTPDVAARSWLDAGASAVVLTDGSAGLTAYTREVDEVAVDAVAATVVDTIGAGDTTFAALLARLDADGVSAPQRLSRREWTQLLRYAARAAAHTVSVTGAEPPTVDQL